MSERAYATRFTRRTGAIGKALGFDRSGRIVCFTAHGRHTVQNNELRRLHRGDQFTRPKTRFDVENGRSGRNKDQVGRLGSVERYAISVGGRIEDHQRSLRALRLLNFLHDERQAT